MTMFLKKTIDTYNINWARFVSFQIIFFIQNKGTYRQYLLSRICSTILSKNRTESYIDMTGTKIIITLWFELAIFFTSRLKVLRSPVHRTIDLCKWQRSSLIEHTHSSNTFSFVEIIITQGAMKDRVISILRMGFLAHDISHFSD